jgi:hypothetical protein
VVPFAVHEGPRASTSDETLLDFRTADGGDSLRRSELGSRTRITSSAAGR